MIKSGLVSITFRQLSPEEIISLVVESGLQAIEWGGDVHVPHGDVKHAKLISSMTKEAGIEIAAYGSYYRVGNRIVGKNEPIEFERVLDTALALQAPSIRVWAGNLGSEEVDESFWNLVIEDSRRIADLAASANVTIDFEFHRNTLTDTTVSTVRLLTEVDHPNIRSLWQPPVDTAVEQRLDGLQQVLPWLTNLHVYQWQAGKRLELRDGVEEWRTYIDTVMKLGRSHYALLEFVREDDPDQFLKDAETLKNLLR